MCQNSLFVLLSSQLVVCDSFDMFVVMDLKYFLLNDNQEVKLWAKDVTPIR